MTVDRALGGANLLRLPLAGVIGPIGVTGSDWFLRPAFTAGPVACVEIDFRLIASFDLGAVPRLAGLLIELIGSGDTPAYPATELGLLGAPEDCCGGPPSPGVEAVDLYVTTFSFSFSSIRSCFW